MNEKNPGQLLRQQIRGGEFDRPTAGEAPGYVQANLVAVPRSAAFDFLLFCQRNPKPCPLLEVIEPGSVEAKRLAPGSDLSRDIPRYRIFKDGELVDEPTDASSLWGEDMVGFLLGCSFSFEKPLLDAGLEVRHISCHSNVPMYRTNIPCKTAGIFAGPLVVSMRPYRPEQALKAAVITAKLPQVHGAPVHQGDPGVIGIADLANPDYGDAVPVREGEIPVFWACGVTPQAALLQARLPLAITHSPGHMFVSDISEQELPWLNESIR